MQKSRRRLILRATIAARPQSPARRQPCPIVPTRVARCLFSLAAASDRRIALGLWLGFHRHRADLLAGFALSVHAKQLAPVAQAVQQLAKPPAVGPAAGQPPQPMFEQYEENLRKQGTAASPGSGPQQRAQPVQPQMPVLAATGPDRAQRKEPRQRPAILRLIHE